MSNTKDPARRRMHNARWEATHPRENAAMRAARRARRAFGEAVHWSIFFRLMAQPCTSCAVTPSDGVDHIVPKPAGGRNVESNLQPMCLSCNHQKGARASVKPTAQEEPCARCGVGQRYLMPNGRVYSYCRPCNAATAGAAR